jgi:hypothetical protein
LPLTSVGRRVLICVLMVVHAAVCLAQSGSSDAPDLDPELSAMLARDSACESGGTVAGADQIQAPAAASARAPFSVQTMHNSRGRNVGIIATLENACHCSQGNCATYVYVKSGQTYQVALKESLASLRPLRGFKQTMPALSGKLIVSDSRAETIIYEWDGSEYRAGICATVVQRNKGHPVITKHPCVQP